MVRAIICPMLRDVEPMQKAIDDIELFLQQRNKITFYFVISQGVVTHYLGCICAVMLE